MDQLLLRFYTNSYNKRKCCCLDTKIEWFWWTDIRIFCKLHRKYQLPIHRWKEWIKTGTECPAAWRGVWSQALLKALLQASRVEFRPRYLPIELFL